MPAAETSFTALRVEGGLFPAEFLARIAALEAPAQRPDDYDVPPGRTVRDEIGRYWTIAEALWKEYRSQSQREGHDRSRVGVERWMTRLLRDVFGYGDLTAASSRSVIGERSFPITHWAYGGKLPLLITTADHSLDKSDRLFGEDGRKRAPHATMQEFLNADTAVLWGVVTNGVRLRILRDNPSLTRPAFVEADFERIFDEGLYADFTALWLLLHASRFAPDAKGVAGTRLEAWRAEGAKTGQRALEKLRAGVTTALRELGTGFVENPANDALRIALRDGTLTADGLHQQLLRLVYRMLLLFTAEERDLLHPPEADADARDVYRDGYSLGRVRDRARFRRHYDRYGDLWAGLTTTFRALSRGSKPLGLPAMGGLFDPLLCPDLDKAELANSRLLAAVHALAYFTSDGALSRVNYRDMGTEELGSVYESLLELHPVVQVAERPWTFGFVGDDLGGSAKGNERKLSGSYYTPDSLVQELLRSALDPVIERTITENPGDPRAALLKLRVIDPACGSGHFLLGAARRLADAVARLDAESDLPDEAIRRHALREVVRRCIYGVDRNPLSVELCKTALWIEAIEPGKPLSFLDAHVKCGDSLVGVFDLKVLKDGIPDDAFKELTGDDKVYCRDLKKRNAAERKTPHLGFLSDASVPPALAAAFNALTELPEDTVEQVEEEAHALKRLQKGQATYDLKVACDLWCAAFFLPKAGKPEFVGRDLVPTTDTVWRYVRAPSTVYGPLIGATSEVAGRARFFHWPLEFPEAFAVGGFDCVLGNPPWETMSPDYKEFFSAFDEGIRHLSPQEQDIAFKSLLSDKMIATLWEEHCLSLYASVNFMKSSGRYRLFAEGNLGKGDFNVYRMFVETALALTRKERVAAQFVPEGLYNGANATAIRKEIFGAFRLSKIGGFENTRGIWFPSIDTRMKFCLYVAWKEGKTEDFFAAFNINSHDRLQAFSNEIGLRIPMSIIMDFSPETYSLLEFSSQREIDICARMYVKYPRFGENIAGYPFREYMREVDSKPPAEAVSRG
ncbi:MAG: N-6 DNA methylase [Fimbriimonadaceae bacterium]|nr:N-6 DNA methylase [Fimbriimonadaceae bacterium]